MTLRVLLSCGEPSGDLYAAALTRELRTLVPGADIFGLGGPQFVAAGGRAVADYRGLSVTGLTEPIAKIPQFMAARRALLESATQTRPDVFVPVDFWGFNHKLARRLARQGVPVAYYVSPQLWATRPWRLKTMREIATRVLVIFPFEEAIYRDAHVPVEFVGHPLIDLAKPSQPRPSFLSRLGLQAAAPTIALLPGSRAGEVSRILPDLVAAASLVRAQVTDAQFVVARAANLDDSLFDVLRGGRLPRSAVVEARCGHGAGVCRRRVDGVRHRDGSGRAPRCAHGDRVPRVAVDLPAGAAAAPGRHVRDGEPDCRQPDRARVHSGRVHATRPLPPRRCRCSPTRRARCEFDRDSVMSVNAWVAAARAAGPLQAILQITRR